MSLWMVRAGSHGEYENKFLDESRIYCTWEELNYNLENIKTINDLREHLQKVYNYEKKGQLINHSTQVWGFVKSIEIGDWIVLPSKIKSAIHFAKVKSSYKFDKKAEDPYYHFREVDWFSTDIPRTVFSQDLLHSFSALMTICQIKRNNAESRIKELYKSNWKPETVTKIIEDSGEASDTDNQVGFDLEQISRDQIAKLIIARFKGHGMARLIDGILKAQGYTTYVSPEGPDKGIDIVAATGSLGFDHPRLCVQVKSGDSPLDHPTLNQLIGSMQNVNAEHGLLVSWGGFKSTINKEKSQQFFRVRLWDQVEVIKQLLTYYDRLDEEIKAELPLKRIWAITSQEE